MIISRPKYGIDYPVRIETRAEYEFVSSRGISPLLDYKHFFLLPSLRVEIQREIFGGADGYVSRRDIPVANERFFRWVWKHKTPNDPHVCEECGRPLHHYSAMFCSHVLARGAHAEMAHDPRNINILCGRCHEKWENGKRSEMKIAPGNDELIRMLRSEYNSLNIGNGTEPGKIGDIYMGTI